MLARFGVEGKGPRCAIFILMDKRMPGSSKLTATDCLSNLIYMSQPAGEWNSRRISRDMEKNMGNLYSGNISLY
jgi:hypothetical protein